MHVIAAAAGNGIDNTAHRPAEFCRKAVREHLELLYGVLRNLRRNACSPSVLVIEAVRCVVAVGKECIAHRSTTETDQSECTVISHCGCQQYERVDTAAIDGQIINLHLSNHLRYATLRVLNQRRFSSDGDRL